MKTCKVKMKTVFLTSAGLLCFSLFVINVSFSIYNIVVNNVKCFHFAFSFIVQNLVASSNGITKQGYLLKGPEAGNERIFVNIGSKSFKRRYCYLR